MSNFNKRFLDFGHPFIESLTNIYSTMIGIEISAGKPTLGSQGGTLGKYSALIGMSGSVINGEGELEFKGSVLLSWDNSAFLKTSSGILGMDFTEFCEDIADVGLEIANMTMGGAKTVLAEKSFKIGMSTPTSIIGEATRISGVSNSISIVTPFDIDGSSMIMEINYWDKNVDFLAA
jgi:CheY-specific phosphatase CheX